MSEIETDSMKHLLACETCFRRWVINILLNINLAQYGKEIPQRAFDAEMREIEKCMLK